MRKLDCKSMAIGFAIAAISFSTVFAVSAAGTIRQATYSQAKVYFYGQEVPLDNPLVSIVAEGKTDARLYMPVRELLEYMHFNVQWHEKDNAVYLTMKGNPGSGSHTPPTPGQAQPYAWDGSGTYNGGYDDDPATLPQAEADRRAADIMQRTGNWRMIEPYLPHMTSEGIAKIIDIYNAKRVK